MINGIRLYIVLIEIVLTLTKHLFTYATTAHYQPYTARITFPGLLQYIIHFDQGLLNRFLLMGNIAGND